MNTNGLNFFKYENYIRKTNEGMKNSGCLRWDHCSDIKDKVLVQSLLYYANMSIATNT